MTAVDDVRRPWPGAPALAEPPMPPDEWLRLWRPQGIGGSDVASIMRLPGAFGTPMQTWWSKKYPTDTDNEWFEFGHMIEHALRPWYEKRTGHELAAAQLCLVDPQHPWRRVSLDDVAWHDLDAWHAGDRPIAVVEMKAASWRSWSEIPVAYQAQGQYEMALAGLDQVDFAVLHGRRFEIYTLDADPVDQAAILEAVDRFWHDHVVADVPPLAHAGDAGVLAERWPRDNGETVVLPDDLVIDLRAARATLARWKQTADELQTQLRALMGEASTAVDSEGTVVATWRAGRPQEDPRTLGLPKPRRVRASNGALVDTGAAVPDRARRFYEPVGRTLRIAGQEDES